MASTKRTVPAIRDWDRLPDEELLRLRIRDLGLRIEGSVLEGRIQRLYDELAARNIGLRPPCYLADEWLTPDGVPVIGIPFFLAHPRLTRLERTMMLEVEGESDEWCMRLLRHEAGHVINYAYRLYRRTRWRELFGPISARYSADAYPYQPYSRRYVRHLPDNYAQAHPDEDFAETFAVWLDPRSDWRRRYREWPAFRKLRYVDRLMATVGGAAPSVTGGQTPWAASRMRSTLGAYYDRKRRLLGEEFPGYYDPGLRRIFTVVPPPGSALKASRFLRRHRRRIVDGVAMWIGERKYDIDKLVRKLTVRCEAMGLYLRRSEIDTVVEVTAFVTAVANDIHHFREASRT